jgi:hypothetical protein
LTVLKFPKFLGLTFQHFWTMLCRERFHLTTDSKDYNDVSFEKNPFFPTRCSIVNAWFHQRSPDMTHRQYKVVLCLTYIVILISLLLLAIQTASFV